MRESKIERYLRAEIAKLGGTAEKKVVPGVRGPPDQEVAWEPVSPGWIRAGQWLSGDEPDGKCAPVVEFIETKAPDGKLSVLQKRDHARRRAMGFQVHVIWTMEQAEEYLKSRGKR